jgi:hypothetical protein
MTDKTKSEFSSLNKNHLTVIFFFYAISALIFGFAYRFEINPDGISYISLAEHIVAGNLNESVSGIWAPLFTWLMSPFIFIGIDGLTTARMVIALSGAGVLLAGWLLTERFNISKHSQFLALLIAALLIADWSIRNIGPDLLIAALIIFYLYLSTDPDILENKKKAVLCGLVGALAYFAKHYAFWFFLAHFPLVLGLKAYIDRDKGFLFKKYLTALIIGISVFLIVSSIWIMVLSAKFERFTISPSGNLVHAKVGPKDMDRRDPSFYGGLHKPINAYSIHQFEDPAQIANEYKKWSAFESKEYFVHQLYLVKNNIKYIYGHFVKNSPFFTYPFIFGILVLIPIALLTNSRFGEYKFLYCWIIITFGGYFSGHLLTYARGTKYFYPLMLLALFLYVHFIEGLINGLRDVRYVSRNGKKLLTVYLVLIVSLAFTVKPGLHLLKSVNSIIAVEQVNPYWDIAEQVKTIEFSSPYAIIRSSQKSYTDYHIAYYLKKQLLGRPLSNDVEGITKELKAVHAKSLLVFDNLEIVKKFKNDGQYLFLGSKMLRKDERYWNATYIERDVITAWDENINVFALK